MRFAHKVALGSLLVLALGAALLADTDWLAPLVERRIAAQTGRHAQINSIELRVGRCLHIAVSGVRIANPEWAESPNLVDARRLGGCAAWLGLLAGRLDFKEATIDTLHLGLEREGDRVTWSMEERKETGTRRATARHISVVDSRVFFRDRGEQTALDVGVSGGVGAGDELHLNASGRFRGARLQLSASTPAQFPSEESPTPITAEAVMGATTANATGHFTQLGLDSMDVELSLAGDDLSALNRLGITLPGTPPYKLEGRLEYTAPRWSFSSFEGAIGDSDIRGELSYTVRKPRSLLRADVHARLLDFDDLGPLVGAPPKTKGGETASPEQKAQAGQLAQHGRVLPTRALGMSQWPRMDADVRFRADRVQRPKAVPLDGLSAHLRIDDGSLSLHPLTFEIAGGHVATDIVIDGKSDPPHGSLTADIKNLDLERLLPELEQQRAAAGELYGRVKLEATGDSIASLAARTNGEITLMVNGGHVSALLLEMAGLDAGESLLILATRGDEPVDLRCAILDFNLQDGQASPELAVVDTVDTVFMLEGAVALGEETLDLTLTPQPKDVSLPVLRSPLSITGHFVDPDVKPVATPLLARGGAAVALALVNPLLAVIPLIETGPSRDSDCAAFARIAKGEGVTAPPNATAHPQRSETL